MLVQEERWRESERGEVCTGGWSMNVSVWKGVKGGANKDHLRRGELWEEEK